MSKHLYLGGADYLSTADVNLLDADTAHIQQGIGKWKNISGSSAFGVSTDLTPVYGSSHLAFTVASAGANAVASTETGTASIPCSPSTTYYAVVSVSSDADNSTVQLRYRDYDSSGVQGSNADIQTLSVTAGQWTTFGASFTTAADAAYMAIQVSPRSNPNAGQKYYVSAAMLAASDVAFVPSLRIVGDLDVRAKIAADLTATGYVIYKGTSFNQSYFLRVRDTGILSGRIINTAANQTVEGSTALVAGDDYEIRMTYDADAGVGALTTFIDNVQDNTGGFDAGALVPDSGPAVVGADNGGTNAFYGKVYWAEVRDGISGPVVARFSATDLTAAEVEAAEVTQ